MITFDLMSLLMIFVITITTPYTLHYTKVTISLYQVVNSVTYNTSNTEQTHDTWQRIVCSVQEIGIFSARSVNPDKKLAPKIPGTWCKLLLAQTAAMQSVAVWQTIGNKICNHYFRHYFLFPRCFFLFFSLLSIILIECVLE